MDTDTEVVKNSYPYIIFFDGVCNLCNASVNFIIDRDKRKVFGFASLQSEFAKQKLASYPLFPALESILLLKDGRLLVKSDAALEIARHLGGAWPLLAVFRVVPKGIRDSVYNGIARNRYRWFGKRESCRIPTPELKERFLDS